MPLFAEVTRLRAALDALRPLAPEQEARVLQKFRPGCLPLWTGDGPPGWQTL